MTVSTIPVLSAMLLFHKGGKKMLGQNFQKSYGNLLIYSYSKNSTASFSKPKSNIASAAELIAPIDTPDT